MRVNFHILSSVNVEISPFPSRDAMLILLS